MLVCENVGMLGMLVYIGMLKSHCEYLSMLWVKELPNLEKATSFISRSFSRVLAFLRSSSHRELELKVIAPATLTFCLDVTCSV